jgi:translocation and assembly module TamA
MRCAFIGLTALALTITAPCRAANPQPYNLSIPGTGVSSLDDALHAVSLLSSLRTTTPAAPFALIDRARGDVDRFEKVLHGFGYFKARVSFTIDNRDLSNASLPEILERVPQGRAVDVIAAVDTGPRYHLRRIEIEGAVPQDARAALKLEANDPAIAQNVLNAGSRLLSALEEDGYAFAKVDPPVAYADDQQDALDVTFKVDTGPHVRIGPILIEGLKEVNEKFARSALTVHTGDQYKPSAIETARQSLLKLGVFSGVSVRAAQEPSQGDSVPLVFDVQERPRHAVSFSGTYSTDLGVSLSGTWSHRNLFGNAEQLNLSAATTGLGGTATAGLGYDVSAQFIKPRLLSEAQELEADVTGLKQNLDAYDQTAVSLGLYLRRTFSVLWKGSAGLAATHDEVAQEGIDRLYELVGVPVTVLYDSTGLKDLLADPTHGLRATLMAKPTLAFGRHFFTFAVLQASGSTYFDISGDGRSVLATRALVASIVGASNFDLPPDQRLYAGGTDTVRGFRYQSIGPHFADGKPAGATSADATTLEFRQRFGSDWGAVTFVDAGQASVGNIPFRGSVEVGAGVGARYYTSIGSIRLDVAVPVTRVPHSDAFEIYISLGQAF